MKIVIGDVEVEILNGGRLIYDNSSQTLSIQQSSMEPSNRLQSSKPLMIAHETTRSPAPTGLTKTVLIHKIMQMVEQASESLTIYSITINCLGTQSTPQEKKYLKLLLEELVEKNKLSVSLDSGRRRFSIP